VKHKKLIYLLILTLLLTMIPVLILSGRITPKAETTTVVPKARANESPAISENPYHDKAALITALPTATVIDDFSNMDSEPPFMRVHVKNDYFAETRDAQEIIGFGTLMEYTSVLCEIKDQYQHIVTMAIRMDLPLDDVSQKGDIIHAIYIQRYFKDENSDRLLALLPMQDFAVDAIKNPYGFFVMRPVANSTLFVQDQQYPLSDYADYQITLRGDYDPKKDIITVNKNVSFSLDNVCQQLSVLNPYADPLADPSLLRIPNTKRFTHQESVSYPCPDTLPPIEEYVSTVKKSLTALDGSISQSASLMIEDGDTAWHITTMELRGSVKTFNERVIHYPMKTIHVYAYHKYGDHYLAFDTENPDHAIRATEQTKGLFILKRVKDETVTIGGITYQLRDYADWILIDFFLSDGDSFVYHRNLISYPKERKYSYEIFR